MGSGDLAPNGGGGIGFSTWGSGLVQLLVDVADTFAQVEGGVFLFRNTFDLEEGSFFVLVTKTTSVSNEG